MELKPGDKLGPYEIVSAIGKGGMGEVYKARDTRLDRIVALKVSAAQFSERFEREAKAIGALNHPNICTLYDVGPNYLVMEYIEGTPLKGPLPVDQALKYAVQISDALDAAHKKGITHRDLKPANILVTKAGIKLLDFGLAKLGMSGTAQAAKLPDEATLTMALTGKNEIVGTLYYMSPEQLQAQATGQEIDPRTDIFSFGLVLYEMLTGKRAFEGSSPASVIAAIMERPAPSIAAVAPAAVDRLLQRCLNKDPDDRWQTARDLRAELEWIAAGPEEATLGGNVGRRRSLSWLAACLLFVLALALAAVGWYRATRRPDPKPLARLNVDLGPDTEDDVRYGFALSPDGTKVAFRVKSASGSGLAILSLDQGKAVPVPGTEGGGSPFFSADSEWLGFANQGKTMKVSVHGGQPVTLCAGSSITGAAWGENGIIVASIADTSNPTQVPLAQIPDSGGTPKVLTPLAPGEATHRFPQFLPGGEYVLYTAHTLLDEFDNARIRVVSVKTGQAKTVVSGAYFGRYIPTGHLLFVRGGILYGVRFDLANLETRGTPVALVEDLRFSAAWGFGGFEVSRTGMLFYRKPIASAWPLVWLDANGKTEPLLSAPGQYYTPRLSPDGSLLAFSDGGTVRGNIRAYDWKRNKLNHVTTDNQGHIGPVWAPDGNHIAYRTRSSDKGDFSIDWARPDGAGEPQRLLTSKVPVMPESISTDGRFLAYLKENAGWDIWTLPLDLTDPERPKAGTPQEFVATPDNELQAAFSPDGKWISYVSNTGAAGRFPYVSPFRGRSSRADQRWRIAERTLSFPTWSRTGNQIFASADRIRVLNYRTQGDSFIAEPSRIWSPTPILDLDLFQNFDASPDGKRMVIAPHPDARDEQEAISRLTVLMNFFDEVQRKIP
jgi:serine/threonine-protein kinase